MGLQHRARRQVSQVIMVLAATMLRTGCLGTGWQEDAAMFVLAVYSRYPGVKQPWDTCWYIKLHEWNKACRLMLAAELLSGRVYAQLAIVHGAEGLKSCMLMQHDDRLQT